MTYFDFQSPVGRRQEGAAVTFRHYDPDRILLGRRMEDHLRVAVCYWHSFGWPGADVFGAGTLDRPWQGAGDPMALAVMKADAAFDFFTRLGAPFYTFHDADVAPAGRTLADYRDNLSRMVDVLARKQEETGVRLLWGTANCFSHPRYAAGAATNPDPEVFACAATQVAAAMAATHRLGGANYVLWGGREGYETLLNTDLRREREQLGRFMTMVVEYKHRLGFKGTILIEPKPREPTKHQYDFDCATVDGFLRQFGLADEIRVNIEANHATLAGHSFLHEVATALSLGLFGSIDANRGDPQTGWDTDQFPNSVEEISLVLYEILRAGGLTTGGFNFDARLSRQSIDPVDLFHAHVGAMDVLALGLDAAARMIADDQLARNKAARYAGWDRPLGRDILDGHCTLDGLADRAVEEGFAPAPVSGGQERLENIVTRVLYG